MKFQNKSKDEKDKFQYGLDRINRINHECLKV